MRCEVRRSRVAGADVVYPPQLLEDAYLPDASRIAAAAAGGDGRLSGRSSSSSRISGEGVHEAQVLAWKVQPGQQVAAFQPLCEVESAKAAVELTAPVAGRVRETPFAEGAIAHLGDVLVVIDTDGNGSASAVRLPSSPEGEPEWFGIVGSSPHPERPTLRRPPPPPVERVRAAPFVRKLARDLRRTARGRCGLGAAWTRAHRRCRGARGPAGRNREDDPAARACENPSPTTWSRPGATRPRSPPWTCFDVTELVRARDAARAVARRRACG